MRILSPTSRWIAPFFLLFVSWTTAGCATRGLDVEAPAPPSDVEISRPPVSIGLVTDARAFTDYPFVAPLPTTSRDPGDPAWTRRVFGRRRASLRSLGGDWYTRDPAGVPALVRAALANGLVAAGHPAPATDVAAPGDAPRLDAVIESFWIRQAFRSAHARLIYEAEISVSGDWPGFESPVLLRAHGSIISGAADGVLWRRTLQRTLEKLSASLAEELQRDPGTRMQAPVTADAAAVSTPTPAASQAATEVPRSSGRILLRAP